MANIIKPTAIHTAFRNDVLELLGKHAGTLPADQMLALACHLVGQIIAMQDQRRFTAETVMTLVNANIQLGNQHAQHDLIHKTAGHG